MLIYSQNLTNYGTDIPKDALYRINLAWINSIPELEELLEKHQTHKIFLDLPIGRTKPPHNKYSLDEIIPVIKSHDNVTYFAISNVNSSNDLKKYVDLLPDELILVPKIESPDGISNIQEIVNTLPTKEKVIMLDHDDLFSQLTKRNEPPTNFKRYITELTNFCNNNNVIMLRTIGVIFSDSEKRLTQYSK